MTGDGAIGAWPIKRQTRSGAANTTLRPLVRCGRPGTATPPAACSVKASGTGFEIPLAPLKSNISDLPHHSAADKATASCTLAQHRPPAARPGVGSAPTVSVDDHDVLVNELSSPVPAGAAARPSARRREGRGGGRDPQAGPRSRGNRHRGARQSRAGRSGYRRRRAAILGVDHAPRVGTASSDWLRDSRGQAATTSAATPAAHPRDCGAPQLAESDRLDRATGRCGPGVGRGGLMGKRIDALGDAKGGRHEVQLRDAPGLPA